MTPDEKQDAMLEKLANIERWQSAFAVEHQFVLKTLAEYGAGLYGQNGIVGAIERSRTNEREIDRLHQEHNINMDKYSMRHGWLYDASLRFFPPVCAFLLAALILWMTKMLITVSIR